MGNKIILYGASGHSKVIIDILERNNQVVDYVIDDNPNCCAVMGMEVVRRDVLNFSSDSQMILSIGNNEVRKKLATDLMHVKFATAVHPNAIISRHASLDEGTVVMGGAVINAEASIGKHVIVNTNAVVEHDCVISDYVHVSPNASLAGGVFVGEGSQIGIGASVIQNVKIGKWTVIGAGAVIIRDVPDYAVVVGNPGKVIKIKANE
ncbi:acetyltransferase [Flavobacterium amniphilum]|uniref:acetyltransferase n=1 Tax=Flavobacterium amniphilum TaxID=1834035 RepID=UPI002029BA53|nr:acetyltransferase [Flavobacterium amniphilum]MCL9805126.1 acetyltransferase [Flavobacterium amniphilum]